MLLALICLKMLNFSTVFFNYLCNSVCGSNCGSNCGFFACLAYSRIVICTLTESLVQLIHRPFRFLQALFWAIVHAHRAKSRLFYALPIQFMIQYLTLDKILVPSLNLLYTYGAR